MPKYTFDQVKQNVAKIANRNEYTKDFIFELMAAYGRSMSSIRQLKTGVINKSSAPDTLLQKDVIYFKLFSPNTQLEEKVEAMSMDPLSERYQPRYIIATDLEHIVAKDTVKYTTLDIAIKDIDNEVAFFYGWTGSEINGGNTDESIADRRAADKMKDLYDEIERENADQLKIRPLEFRHELNVFFSRLLFCFFAEDTELFKPQQFTNAVKEFTEADGSDLHIFFEELFKSLDSEDKTGITTPYSEFPYVNGLLFASGTHDIAVPRFTPTARHILILCADLDWSGVNPDIFGTIFQGVVDEKKRNENGMDYTSVPNILKVIDPLFMKNLHEEFDKSFDDEEKIRELWDRISKIKIFDPACGSGNFLIISYKKLRELEHSIIRRLNELMATHGAKKSSLDAQNLSSRIKLSNFHGIELEDFPRELAVLSLYITAHQMNIEFEKEFGKKLSIIPLKDMPTIACGNAASLDWNKICPNNGIDEIYVIGNPPYKGADKQTLAQRNDFKTYFQNEKISGNADYITIWFVKGARYISNTRAELAFVSTNSVCQGEHAGIMFPKIFDAAVDIHFAYRSFKWANNAKNNAGVSVVIIGLKSINIKKPKIIYEFIDGECTMKKVEGINAYLSDTNSPIIIKRIHPLCPDFPPMVSGSMPRDGGHLILDSSEKQQLISDDPRVENFIKKYCGGIDLVRGGRRYCFWIDEQNQYEANFIPSIKNRINLVQLERSKSKAPSTRNFANVPYRFCQISYKKEPCLASPRVSSERRQYIPMDFLDAETIPSFDLLVIYNAQPWLFAILQSKMHMVWIKAVCGKLETRYRYSSTLGYNTFPCPSLTDEQKTKLNASARNILFARANHPELTLADLYNPHKTPDDLLQAHTENDIVVDKIYRPTPFLDDETRLSVLFKLYAQMISEELKVASADTEAI